MQDPDGRGAPGRAWPADPRGALLDVDGTLIDTNELHTLAWCRALRRFGVEVPMARIHRRIGMGGSEMLEDLLGEARDDLEEAWKDEYRSFLPEIRVLPGARALLGRLLADGWPVALATSGPEEFVDRTAEVLGLDDLDVTVVNSSEVESAKPAPDLFGVAAERIGVEPARCVAVGDTVWDVRAAARAGIACVTVRSGGIGAAELIDAGAVAVYDDPADLLAHWPYPRRRRAAPARRLA